VILKLLFATVLAENPVVGIDRRTFPHQRQYKLDLAIRVLLLDKLFPGQNPTDFYPDNSQLGRSYIVDLLSVQIWLSQFGLAIGSKLGSIAGCKILLSGVRDELLGYEIREYLLFSDGD
jgi:hypothetical protein